jgi:hypothetical protein
MNELGQSRVSQYMIIATKKRGAQRIHTEKIQENKGQIVMKIFHGRIGQREAWWPIEAQRHRHRGQDKEWAWRRREPADEDAEDMWLIRVGAAPVDHFDNKHWDMAVRELETFGIR